MEATTTYFYKIQYMDRVSLSWKDIQLRFASIKAASDYFNKKGLDATMPQATGFRIMECTDSSRKPVFTF